VSLGSQVSEEQLQDVDHPVDLGQKRFGKESDPQALRLVRLGFGGTSVCYHADCLNEV